MPDVRSGRADRLKLGTGPTEGMSMSVVVLGIAGVCALVLLILRSRSDETISMPPDAGRSADPVSVESLVRSGRKIEAIKLLREQTGLGLKEAKDQVDALFRHR
jgi:ribosomal protein L7/L12